MHPFRLVSALAFATLVVGCSGKNPTAPTATAVTALAVTGADAVLTGRSTSYTVTATSANGTSRPVTPTWSSSNPQVATIDSAGQLEGRAHGSTTLTATFQGQTVLKTVHVVNNYGGTWQGSFIAKACDAPPGVCDDYEIDTFSFPIYLQISQTGTDQSDINARLIFSSLYDLRASVSGRVTSDGRLNLFGSSEVARSDGRIWATFELKTWDTVLSDGGMTGGWQQHLSILQPPSTENLDNELVTMKRISNIAGAMSEG